MFSYDYRGDTSVELKKMRAMQRFDYCTAPKYQIIADGPLFLQQKTLLLLRMAKVKVIKVSCKISTCHDLLRSCINMHGFSCVSNILSLAEMLVKRKHSTFAELVALFCRECHASTIFSLKRG